MNSLKHTFVVALAASVLFGVTAAKADSQTDRAFAAHTLTMLDGSEATLSSFRGEVVVVNFWASWCAPCRKELHIFDEWNEAWADRGARIVAISIDKEQRMARRFVEKEELSLTVFHDGPAGLARTLDLPSLPCTFVLDRDGKVVKIIQSSSSKDLASVKSTVESILRSKPAVQEAGLGSTGETTPSPKMAPEPEELDTSNDGGTR